MRKIAKSNQQFPFLDRSATLACACLGLLLAMLASPLAKANTVSVQELAQSLRHAPHIQQRELQKRALLKELDAYQEEAASPWRAFNGAYQINNRWNMDTSTYVTDLAVSLNTPLDYQSQLGLTRAQTALQIEQQRFALEQEQDVSREALFTTYVQLWADYQLRHASRHFLKAWRNMILVVGYGQKRGEWTSADVRSMRVTRLQIEHAIDDYNLSISNFQEAIRALIAPESTRDVRRFDFRPTRPKEFAECLSMNSSGANQGLSRRLALLDAQIEQLTDLSAYNRQHKRAKNMEVKVGMTGVVDSEEGLSPYFELNLSMDLMPADSTRTRLDEGVAREGVDSLRRERTQLLLDLEQFKRAVGQIHHRQSVMVSKRQQEIALQVLVMAENIQRLKFRDIEEYQQLFANFAALYDLQRNFIIRQRDILLDGAVLAAKYNLDLSSRSQRGCRSYGPELSLDRVYKGLAMPNFTEVNLQEFDLGWGVAAADVVGRERVRYQRQVDSVYEMSGPQLAEREAKNAIKLDATLDGFGGIYLWYPEGVIETEQTRQDFLAKIKKLGMNRVSFSFTPRLYREVREGNPESLARIKDFMSEAKAEGFAIELLLGDSNWILPKFRGSLVKAVEILTQFPFDAISLDLEPNMLEDQGFTERELLPDLLKSIEAVSQVTRLPLSLSAHPRIFTYDDYSCYACELQKVGIGELKLMIYITNAEKVDFRMKTVKSNSPKDMEFSLAISMEPILGKVSSFFHTPRGEIAHQFEELVIVAKNNNLKSVMVQAWTETNRYFYEN